MKKVELKIKKVEIDDYYAQLDQVKVRILYNDGEDRVLTKQFSIKEASKHSKEIISQIKKEVRARGAERDYDDDPLAGALIIKYAQDIDEIAEKTEKFLNRAKERIKTAKLAKMSYWDLAKQLQGSKIEF